MKAYYALLSWNMLTYINIKKYYKNDKFEIFTLTWGMKC